MAKQKNRTRFFTPRKAPTRTCPADVDVTTTLPVTPAPTVSQIVTTSQPVAPFVPPHLPNEIIWQIFSIFLIATKWTGWTRLLQLHQEKYLLLLSDAALIRNTLPQLHGGTIATLEWLYRKMTGMKDRRYPILCVMNGVASALTFKDQQFRERLRLMVLHHEFPGLFYVDVINVACSFSLTTGVSAKACERILTELIRLQRLDGMKDEYER